jgi:ABC-type phosphate/phosphonate transport system substrate-binding protein
MIYTMKLNEEQATKITNILLSYLNNNPDDKQMEQLLWNLNFGEQFAQSNDKGTLKEYQE